MDELILFFPVVMMVFGLVGLFVDPNKKGNKYLLVIFVLVICLSAFLDIFQKIISSREYERNRGTKYVVDTILENAAFSKTVMKEVEESQLANKALNQVINPYEVLSLELRGVEITYYPKSLDNTDVIEVLSDVGFSVTAGRSENTLPTNTIWYGSAVPINDIKKLALILIRGGIDIKSIKPFEAYTGKGRNQIQIGSDPKCSSAPNIPVKRIIDASEFTRKSEHCR